MIETTWLILQGIECFSKNRKMYIIEVQPIAILPKQLSSQLSYFIKDAVPIGSIVEIFIQKKKLPAVVISVELLSTHKLKIKSNSFALKKIHRIISSGYFYHPAILLAATHMSEHSQEPIGAILKTFTPSALLSTTQSQNHPTILKNNFHNKQYEILLGSLTDRVQYYKTIIREAFAKNKSIVLFVPTTRLAEYFTRIFGDLPKKPLVIHGNLSKKLFSTNIKLALQDSPPPLIIGTPIALACLHGNENIIIIEDFDSPHYFRQERPYVHAGKVIRFFANEINAKCITGKSMISISDLKNDIKPHYLSSRLNTIQSPILVDTSQESFRVLSAITRDSILKINKRIILFINRKGFYSYVLCIDCGRTIFCANCNSPLTLHVSLKRGYVCHHCQHQYPADMLCSHCQSWNLKGFGIGNEQVLEEIQKLFPYRPVWTLSDEKNKNTKQKDSIKKAFLESTDGILIGTELIVEDPELIAALVVIVHIDNLFSIPDYSIGERILSTLQKLEERSIELPLLIQTRFPKHPVFQYFLRHDYKGFMAHELAERKENSFPPFTTFIKITLIHKNHAELSKRVDFTVRYFKPFDTDVLSYPSFNQKIKHHILISINNHEWQKNAESLKDALDRFPYPADIVVDPPSIL
mgnify:FL=1